MFYPSFLFINVSIDLSVYHPVDLYLLGTCTLSRYSRIFHYHFNIQRSARSCNLLVLTRSSLPSLPSFLSPSLPPGPSFPPSLRPLLTTLNSSSHFYSISFPTFLPSPVLPSLRSLPFPSIPHFPSRSFYPSPAHPSLQSSFPLPRSKMTEGRK